MGQFDYVEPSPSAPRNGPEAVDREEHGHAQDEQGGEVERDGAHHEQRERQRHDDRQHAEPTVSAISGMTTNDTHCFTMSCVAY